MLRDYQKESSDKGLKFLLSGSTGGGLLVLPTGAGKSQVIADIVSRLPAPSIVFQPSKEILQQNLRKFQEAGYNPSVFSASAGRKEIGHITLATIGSVHKNAAAFAHCKFVIIDEAHGVNAKGEETMFVKFLQGCSSARILGLTATPYRLSTSRFGSRLKFLTRTRPRVFSKVVHVVQNQDLVDAGFLATLDYKVVNTGFRSDRLRVNSTGADYTDKSVRDHFKELHFSDQIVRCIRRLDELGRGSSVTFTRFVEEAEYVSMKIPGAETVSAQTRPKDREDLLAAFKAGEIKHITNVGVLAIGFDYPELANVILARPTTSLALYYQMVGRAIRPHPNKKSAFIIDMVGLQKRFGPVERLRVECGPNETWFVKNDQRTLTNITI